MYLGVCVTALLKEEAMREVMHGKDWKEKRKEASDVIIISKTYCE